MKWTIACSASALLLLGACNPSSNPDGGNTGTDGGNTGTDGGNRGTDGGNTGTDGGNPGTDGGGGNVTQAEADLAAAFCNLYATCLPFALHTEYGDVATCTARFSLSFSLYNGLNGFTASSSAIEACATAFGSESCADLRNGAQPPACALGGSLANGAGCGTSVQCQTDYCRFDGGSSCGNCEAYASLGGGCVVDSDCGPGNACGNGQCVTPGGSGVSCNNLTAPCEGSLFCNSSMICAAPATTPGATCEGTASDSCDFLGVGLYCTSSNVCAQATLAPPGNPCGLIAGGLVGCADAGTCIGGLSGTCAAPIGDGQACDADAGSPTCFSPAKCISGTCQLPMPTVCQ